MQKEEKRLAINARLTVASITSLSTNFIRICFNSDKALEVNPLWICPHLKLQFADTQTGEIHFPERDENNKIIWQQGMRERVRTYSIRSYDKDLQQLNVDFVKHPAGVASAWAMHAKLGEQIGLLNMGSRRLFNDKHLVLVGDISAMPAICYTIERKPHHQQITAFIEMNHESDKIQLQDNNTADVKVLIRQLGQASRLVETVIQHSFYDSDNLLFIGGIEGGITQQIRNALKEKYPNLTADAFQIINYWREGLAEGEFKHRE